jgi:putative heme-binding domain-containing protein
LIPPDDRDADAAFPEPSAAERRASRLQRETRRHELLDAALEDDPFIRQAATAGLAANVELSSADPLGLSHPRQRVVALAAIRWRTPDELERWLAPALQDQDDDVCLMSLRVIAEQHRAEFREPIRALLDQRRPLSTRVGAAALATLGWLDEGDDAKDVATLQVHLDEYLKREDAPAELRRLALRSLPRTHSAVRTARLAELFRQEPALRAEIVGVLADRGESSAGEFLAAVARDQNSSIDLRADACAALAAYLPTQTAVLETLCEAGDVRLRREAERSLRERTLSDTRPTKSQSSLADVPTTGDPAAGRRVFFRSAGGRCSSCHVYDGRGGAVGPELTTIHRRADRQWLWNAIVDPNRDVAPRFSAVTLITHDGRTVTGQLMPGPGDDAAETLVDADGTQITLPLEQIAERHYHAHSIMPERLGELLDPQELADLIEFLIVARSVSER